MIGLTRSVGAVASRRTTRSVVSKSIQYSFSTQPIIELREYTLNPEHAVAYMQATAEAAELRKSHVPLRFFSLPETGGQLQVATHAYYYEGGHAERDAKRAVLGGNDDWKAYLVKCRPCCLAQSSTIWAEAPLISEMKEMHSSVNGLAKTPNADELKGDNCILEMRRYKLKLGYDTVPNFLEFYGSGLPSKLSAPGTDPTTSLVSVMYSEVGRLNEVIEIWRHGNGTLAMETSRQAARNAPEWRKAIANIANQVALEFTTTIHKPAGFSPIK